MDTMVGVLVFGLGAAAFYTLMPVLSKGESISKYESVATQVAGRLIEHIQTMRPEDVTAANLERLNLIDPGQTKSPFSFTHIPLDEASRYSPNQALPNGRGVLTVTDGESGSVVLGVMITWRSPSGRNQSIQTGTVIGGYR